MTFHPGQSGNPAGRPVGARGKATIIAEGLFMGEAEAIIRTAIDMAKSGDMSAVRVCLDRIAPRMRDRAIDFELPPLRSAADASAAIAAIATALGAGELTAVEAGELIKLTDAFARTLQATNFEERLVRLERELRIDASKPKPEGEAGRPAQERQSSPEVAR